MPALTRRLTAAQAIAIRAKAHEMGRPSIALAQAFQFELMLRQKDVIGEWVPLAEPGISAVQADGLKWLRGIRWEEIDSNMILTHVTSKRQKEIIVSLINAPMVIAKLKDKISHLFQGPVIVSEFDRLPWTAPEFRRWWRLVANACGVPKAVRNMDSRAGAITEATAAGAGRGSATCVFWESRRSASRWLLRPATGAIIRQPAATSRAFLEVI
jgi:hypothetical protein